MISTPRSGPTDAALVLCAPLGPAGVALLLTHFLPLLGLPVFIPWDARPLVALAFWGIFSLAFYAAVLTGNSSFRKLPEAATAAGRLLKGILWGVGQLLLIMLASMVAGMLLVPSWIIVGAVFLLATSDGLPRGQYAHRVLSDLLLFYALSGALVGGWALMKAWGDKTPRAAGRPPRWLGIALLAALLLGSLGLVGAGLLGRVNPGFLAEIFEPKLER